MISCSTKAVPITSKPQTHFTSWVVGLEYIVNVFIGKRAWAFISMGPHFKNKHRFSGSEIYFLGGGND